MKTIEITVDPKGGTKVETRGFSGAECREASRFVEQGAWRIASTSTPGGIETVAFLNPDGARVLVAFNGGDAAKPFAVQADGRSFAYTLAPNAAATFRWRAPR